MTGQDHASTHDQAEAASDDALERAVAAMTRACGPVVTASPAALMSGLDQAMRDRWAAWMLSGQAKFCLHYLRGGGPAAPVMYWYPVPDPAMVCERCLVYVVAAVTGTSEDLTCDICRSPMEPNGDWMTRTLVLPAWVDERRRQVMPAVNITYAVCGACAKTETFPDQDQALAQFPGLLDWLSRAWRRQPRRRTAARQQPR